MASPRAKLFQLTTNVLLLLLLNVGVETSSWYTLDKSSQNSNYDLRLLSHRIKRSTPTPAATFAPTTLDPASNMLKKTGEKVTESINKLPHDSTSQAPAAAPTTLKPQIPNVGVNGSGIHKDVAGKPKVSDPITPEDGDNATDINSAVFKETPEMIEAEHHLANLTYVNHTFYNSTFIGKPEFFNEYWFNISKMDFEVHKILSSSHRRATTVTLSFDFPFYGLPLKNITVATGGFIYTGDHVHNWLAATQYIAPLMANFDTTPTNDSIVKIADDGTMFTAIWENVTLQEDLNKTFTFAVTLRKDGDIIFAYKDIPIPIQSIEDKTHPVKVGISDAYLQDRVIYYIRRKTIYEYHRVNFMDHNITSGTVLRLHALPTCLLYTSCEACINHSTTFNCSWCSTTERCSSGTDRMKQDWSLRQCDRKNITTLFECSASSSNATSAAESTTPYITSNHDVVMKHDYTTKPQSNPATDPGNAVPVMASTAQAHSSLGGILVAFVTIACIAFVAAWIVYAYKNPHTRSGQLLIKYRPSTWNWKRGEARYTAATIHM